MAYSCPRKLVLVCVFLAPWHGLDVDFGLRVTAFQVYLLALAIVTSLVAAGSSVRFRVIASALPLIVFLSYSILISLATAPYLPEGSVLGGWGRQPGVRSFLQVLILLLIVSPVFIVPAILRDVRDAVACVRVYVVSAAVLAGFGVIQLVIWYLLGSNPIPIGMVSNILGGATEIREGAFEFGQVAIYRMNSFGGEPKDLSVSIVIALVVLQASILRGDFRSRYSLALWLLLILSLLATYSTTGFIVFLLASLVEVFFFLVSARRAGVRRAAVLVKFGVPVLLLVGAFSVVQYLGFGALDLLLDRTAERISDSSLGAFEDFDFAIKEYLLEHPWSALFGVGLGNIHLFANEYLPAEAVRYAGGGVFVAKAQYLKLISETGLVGFCLFGGWAAFQFLGIRRCVRSGADSGVSAVGQHFSIIWPPVVTVFLLAGSSAPTLFVFAGAIAAYRLSSTSARHNTWR
jgi:O-antigen ligase